MGWMQELYKTYDKASGRVGREDDKGCVLLPIAHSTQNAQIEIAINLDGEFKGAKRVEKQQAVTIIPVTEDSASRSSGVAPHPLFDKLCYAAGDYSRFVPSKTMDEHYKSYLTQLTNWYESGCHPYVEAVYQYVKKGDMVRDLIAVSVLAADENGALPEKVKIEGIAQTDAFVRFYIQDERIEGIGEIWKDIGVYDDYIKYYLNQQTEWDLDYITGEYVACSEKQPSKIRNSADKAKLISANDSSGFTYRGRFVSRKEAISVGYVSSQKAHNALKWLIERQAYKRNDLCILVWNPKEKELPNWLLDTDDLLCIDAASEFIDVGEHYADRIKKAILGKYADIDTDDTDIVVLSLDAATPGRLAITYFQEISGSDFLKRLMRWHTTCAWNMGYKKGRKTAPMAPTPEDIVRAAYGNERNGLLEVDKKLMKATLERIMPCILGGRRLPSDIVRAAIGNASRPHAFSDYNNRKILDITCALIYKVYQDKKKGAWISMSLDRTRRERDYLYGRLLAVAHKVEYDTFSETERGKRETNVTRYRERMVKRPTVAWVDLNERLTPYWRKLHPGLKIRYEKEMQEINDLFEPDEYMDPRRLGSEYLLGYSCELSYLWSTAKENNENGGKENE